MSIMCVLSPPLTFVKAAWESTQAHCVITNPYPWSGSVRWCLTEGLVNGDQRRRTGSDSAVETFNFLTMFCTVIII